MASLASGVSANLGSSMQGRALFKGVLVAPAGYVFLIDDDGAYLVDDDGAYLIAEI